MLTLLAMTAMCLLPVEIIIHERVDVIELNHFYDESGAHVFDQMLFIDWNERESRHDIRAWRLVKNGEPRILTARGGYEAWPSDGIYRRRVYAPLTRESWTQYDPELVAREVLPQHDRRELGIPLTKPMDKKKRTPQKPGRK